jgi:hypothetical protein
VCLLCLIFAHVDYRGPVNLHLLERYLKKLLEFNPSINPEALDFASGVYVNEGNAGAAFWLQCLIYTNTKLMWQQPGILNLGCLRGYLKKGVKPVKPFEIDIDVEVPSIRTINSHW